MISGMPVLVGLFRLFIRSPLTSGRMISSAYVLRDLAARFQIQTVLALQDRQRNLWLLDPAKKITVGRSTKCTVVVKENAANVSRSYVCVCVGGGGGMIYIYTHTHDLPVLHMPPSSWIPQSLLGICRISDFPTRRSL
jgi:hypothetical protein